jgi:hypothetical protein
MVRFVHTNAHALAFDQSFRGMSMVRPTRLGWLFAGMVTVGCLNGLAAVSSGRADDVKNLGDQKAKQQTTQAATEDVIQRMGTMLRVLEYYQPDKAQERQALERVATTLVGLSRDQMEEVLRALDKAALEPDAAKSAKELDVAHARHVEIMQTLRELLSEYGKVNSLDQLADKLDRLSRAQLELSLQSTKLLKDLDDPNQDPYRFSNMAANALTRSRNQEFMQLNVEQKDLRKDLKDILAKAAKLKSALPAEQQAVLDNLAKAADQKRVLQTMDSADQQINNLRFQTNDIQTKDLPEAAATQRKGAEDLKDLAAVLRQPKEQIAALRKALDHLDDVIGQEEGLQDLAKATAQAAAKANEDRKAEPLQDFPDANQPFGRGFGGKKGGKGMGKDHIYNTPALALDRSKELSDQQARIALDTRDASNLLRPVANDIAKNIEAVKPTLKTAEDALRKNELADATKPQNRALDGLKDSRAKVADLIAKAEAQKADPLAVLKNIADQLEKILKDQIVTRDQTKYTGDAKQTQQLPKLAPVQQDLAQKTDALNDAPMALKKDTQAALDKAAKAMDKAAQNLQQQKAPPAVAKQNDAIQSLEDAKKSLAEQIAEIEKRRDDIARLQDASQKLDDLTKKENQIADKAKDMANEPKTNSKDLANKQNELTPKAKDLAKALDKAAPKASEKVNEGAKKMDAAKDELDKNQAKPGAKEADDAVEKLKEAQLEIGKKLDDLKSKELAQQQKLQKTNPNAAMQHLEKAIQQTKQAIREAQKAIDAEKQKQLAEMQQDLADKAKDKTFDKAAEPATAAARSLDYGDLDKALQNQQKAMDKLIDDNRRADDAKLQAKGQEGQKKQDAAQAKEGQDQQAKAKQPQLGGMTQAKENGPEKGESKQGQGKEAAKSKDGDAKDGGQGDAKDIPEPGLDDEEGGKAKGGDKGQQGSAKNGQPPPAGQSKASEQNGQGVAKAGPPAQGASQLAQEQQELMDATRGLAQKQTQDGQPSQQSNQGAMQALGQAIASSPNLGQKSLQQAATELGKAGQQLGQGSPEQAKESQQRALDQMMSAIQQAKAAKKINQEDKQQAKAPKDAKGDKDGKDGKDGKGEGKDGKGKGQPKGQKQGQPKGEGKQKDKDGQEKNDNKGKGDRIADGKVNNTRSTSNDMNGVDTFLQLPPRQRELIRQALAGELPPEYAAQIQQYYLNVSRGRSAAFPDAPK